ncbi:MAG: hypothetical protein HY304_06370 [candidate division Zixibacteria bacterium]|nr:hypothetical protein [candidate division Zixibacteria bacterium]
MRSCTRFANMVVCCLIGMLLPSEAHAAVPQLITFQGILKNGSGNPVANGSYSVMFKIYDAPTVGNVLWMETQSVTTNSGLFTTLLGSITAIPDTIFNDSSRYLEIKVAADPPMTPRQKLSSVGYSYVSSQWTSAAQDLFRLNGNVGIGTSAPGAKLDVVASNPYPLAVSATGVTLGVSATGSQGGVFGAGFGSSPSTAYGCYGGGTNSSSGDAIGGWFDGSSTSGTGYGVSATGGAYGGYFTGTGGGSYGVRATGDYYGVSATGGTFGVSATGSGSSFSPVYGCDGSGTNSYFGDAYGGFFTGSSTLGTGYGVYGRGNYYGVRGEGGPFGVSGVGSYDGVFGSGSEDGVRGVGDTYGVYGTSPSGYGVFGYSSSHTGVVGDGNQYGVYGVAHVDNGIGVWGNNGGNAATYAGYFDGKVYVSGLLTKAGGGFKIDHPLEPANKYLYHSFVESPDMKNIYDGVVTIDAKGEAIVTLPDWFGAVNKDFRYQLTAIGAPGPNLYVAQEVSGNQFRIAGGTPATKVSWQVTGIRQDAWANAHRIQVEVEKPAAERGKYLHPTELGLSETLGMNYEETQKMEAERKQQEEQQAKMEQERLRPGVKTTENSVSRTPK